MIYDEDGILENETEVEGGELISNNEDTDDNYITSLLEGGEEHADEDDEDDGK